MYINSEHYVEVPNDLPENKDVSALATLIYVCLLMLKTMYGYSLTSIRQMCDMISLGRIDKVYRRVRSAISELIDIGLIEIHSLEQERLEVNNITKDSSFYVTFETFDDNYFKVFIDDVNQIVRNYKKFSIMDVSNFFRYYLVIQRWTNFQDNIECRHVANSKVKFIVSDNRTIQKYNNTLQEMRIFWFENGYRSSLGNRVISTRFARCRVISQEAFQKKVAQWAIQNDYIPYSKLAVNEKRHNTQLINWDKKRMQQVS